MKALEDLRARAREADETGRCGVAARTISLREIWDGIIGARIGPAIVAARKVLQQLGTELDAGNAARYASRSTRQSKPACCSRLAEEGQAAQHRGGWRRGSVCPPPPGRIQATGPAAP